MKNEKFMKLTYDYAYSFFGKDFESNALHW